MIDFITTMILSFIVAFVAAFLGVYAAGRATHKVLKENHDLRRMIKKLTKWNTTLVKHINERNKEMNLIIEYTNKELGTDFPKLEPWPCLEEQNESEA
jgi:hypothetical protein